MKNEKVRVDFCLYVDPFRGNINLFFHHHLMLPPLGKSWIGQGWNLMWEIQPNVQRKEQQTLDWLPLYTHVLLPFTTITFEILVWYKWTLHAIRPAYLQPTHCRHGRCHNLVPWRNQWRWPSWGCRCRSGRSRYSPRWTRSRWGSWARPQRRDRRWRFGIVRCTR